MQFQESLRIIIAVLSLLIYCTKTIASHALLLQYGENEDSKVIRIEHVTPNILADLMLLDMDIWSRDLQRNALTARVDSDQYELLRLIGDIKITVLVDNLEKYLFTLAQTQSLMRAKRSQVPDPFQGWFEDYHTYAEIKSWYQKLAAEHPDTVKFVPSIGVTHEGRDIFAVQINHTPVRKDKKQIWMQGLIHAREWISGSVVQYISFQLINLQEAPEYLKNVEFIIIPVVNPDGYSYTWTGNRLWRKNMAPGVIGRGVDLNRNFAEHWGEEGASRLPASDTYRGPSPASEPETQAIQNYFLKAGNIVGAIDWHSYSQLILYPHGWTSQPVASYALYQKLTQAMAKAFAKNGRKYQPLKSYNLYPTSGSAMDWFYSQKSPYSITVELPPTATEGLGFLLGREMILPVGDESWAAFQAFARFSVENSIKSDPTEGDNSRSVPIGP